MGVKRLTKQQLQEQLNMWQDFAACARAFAESAQKIADSYQPDIGEYISQSEAARMLGVSPQRICNAVREGELGRYKAGVKVTEVLTWAKQPRRRRSANIKPGQYHID